MLIEFSYGARDFTGWYRTVSNKPSTPEIEEIFQNWGYSHCNSEDFSKQLINVSNTLIFSTITAGLPDDCFLYYDVRDKKMFFTDSIHNIYNFKTAGGAAAYGYAKTASKIPQDAFDWGGNYFDGKSSNFCEVVPDECFDDFLEEIQPYYEYDFKKKLLDMCTGSFNFLQGSEHPVDPQDSDSNVRSKHDSYKLKCDSVFWEVLINDMFHGELFKDFSTKYPRTVQDFLMVLNGLQTHYLTNDNIEYDPRNQSN